MTAALQLSVTPTIEPIMVIEAYGVIRQIDIARVIDLQYRSSAIVWPRHELSYLLREMSAMSYADIGFHTGGRDPTSVMNSLRRIEQRSSEDPAYARSLNALTTQVEAHCTALVCYSRDSSALACRVLTNASHPVTDSEALAVNVLSALAILGSPSLSDAEARRAATHMLGRAAPDQCGGRAHG